MDNHFIRMNKLLLLNLSVSSLGTQVQEGLGPVKPAGWERTQTVIDSPTKPIANARGNGLQGNLEMLFPEERGLNAR